MTYKQKLDWNNKRIKRLLTYLEEDEPPLKDGSSFNQPYEYHKISNYILNLKTECDFINSIPYGKVNEKINTEIIKINSSINE